mmetsp:Transcript_100815/g.289260  ORF Transcript_100815/g.289260 Transcript_100815/m.289260 type:complete len:439 (+) Transcript_100815:31-1347(+)
MSLMRGLRAAARPLVPATAPAASISNYANSVSGEQGHGGRSSISGLKVAVFGATGFLGRYVVNELGKTGTTVTIGNRGCEMETRHLRPMFDLGNMAIEFYSTRDDDSIRRTIEGCDIVINMIGKRYETRKLLPTSPDGALDPIKGSRINFGFDEVNIDIPAKLAKISKEMGVDKFIHVGALSADPDAKSHFSRSKYFGEEAVRKEFPEAVIVKPAELFGHEDRLFNWQGEMGSRLPAIPMLEDGSGLVQPVYVGDVADAIIKMTDDGPHAHHTASVDKMGSDEEEEDIFGIKAHVAGSGGKFKGATLELAGSDDFTRREVMDFVSDLTSLNKPAVPMPEAILKVVASAAAVVPEPWLTVDEVDRWGENVTLDPETDAVTLEDLDIRPVRVEEIAFQYLHRFRKGGHFVLHEGYHANEGKGFNDPGAKVRSIAGNRPFV